MKAPVFLVSLSSCSYVLIFSSASFSPNGNFVGNVGFTECSGKQKNPVQLLLEVIKNPVWIQVNKVLFGYSYKLLIEIVFKSVLPIVKVSFCLSVF